MRTFVLLAVAALGAQPAAAQGIGRAAAPHVDVDLASDVTHVRPGEAFTVGLRFALEDGWHVYWSNPGDSGLAPTLRWELPAGTTAGPLQWPYPQRIAVGPLVNYGYEGEVLLPVAVTPATTLRDGDTLHLAARADWLVCKEDCIPGRADLALDVPVSRAPVERDPRCATSFDDARARLPGSSAAVRLDAQRSEGRVELLIVDAPPGGIAFFPADPEHIENAAPQALRRRDGAAILELAVSSQRREPIERLRGTLVASSGFAPDGAAAVTVDVPVRSAPPAGHSATTAAAPVVTYEASSLWWALAFAVLGGLLLNAMPCVFPVLSIKILDFVRQAGGDPARLRRHGLAYAAGVMLSFWVLVAALLALRAGGEQLGWGFQLQSPAFVVAMIFLLYALAASLLGLFDVGLGVTALAGRAPQGSGLAGSFATGVLATAVATPCTAPFMGPALGFALTLPAASALLVFTALGVGMASPYLLLCFVPGWLRVLPRSGAWLETFKQLMAFPLLATVVWLVWVLGQQAGVDAILGALAGLLLLTLALWLRARFAGPSSPPRRRQIALAASLALSLAGLGTALALRGGPVAGGASAGDDLYGNTWREYSPAALAELLAAGNPVFVDFTAAWCLTCKVNEHVVFSSREVRDAFASRGVVLLRADWTSRDDDITRALASFGRSGVPLYLLYGSTDVAPQILPSVLTRGIVLEALSKLGRRPSEIEEATES